MSATSKDVKILRAVASHVDALVPLFDAYRVFYRQASDLAKARRYVAERLSDTEASVFFLALQRHEAVGFTRLFGTYSSINTRRLWILEDLYVVPAVRKTGIATLLMQRARQHAEETEAVGLTLETAIDNHAAQALYEALGYERERAFYKYNLTL